MIRFSLKDGPAWLRSFKQSIDRELSSAAHFEIYTVATLPPASGAKRWVFVTNESGGAIPAFNDGTNWRRASDRAVVS